MLETGRALTTQPIRLTTKYFLKLIPEKANECVEKREGGNGHSLEYD